MPLLDIQRQAVEIGRIRTGTSVIRKGRNGKDYKQPRKLSTFRFTTRSPRAAAAVAELMGGEVTPWGREWEVITPWDEIPVSVPPGDAAVSQWYELWSGGVCQRRCDGMREHLRGVDCMCPPSGADRTEAAAKGHACKPTTRVNVIIPDLPGIGVWRLEVHGFYAAVELGGAAELLATLRDRGQIVPAILRLEHREVLRVVGRGSDEEKLQPRDYYVPVLEILASFRAMSAVGSGGRLADALPPPPSQMRAIGSTSSQRGRPVVAPESWAKSAIDAPPDAQKPDAGTDPADPSSVAMAAVDATDVAAVRGLWGVADAMGWLGDWVEQPGAAHDAPWVTLRDVLVDRASTLGATLSGGITAQTGEVD